MGTGVIREGPTIGTFAKTNGMAERARKGINRDPRSGSGYKPGKACRS